MSQSSEHSGRVYLVTGAASGMGLATTRLLFARGAAVVATDISEEHLAMQYKEANNERLKTMKLDVTKKDAVRSALCAARANFGRLDGVANFAGTGGHRLGLDHIWETTSGEADFIIDLNVKGVYNILHEGLQEGLLSEPGGSIVHVASMFAEVGYKKGAVFSASKHAAAGMVKSAAIEAGSRGIRVNCVLPGAIETPMYHAVGASGADDPTGPTPINRPGKPDEVAVVTALLLSDQSSFTTGSLWRVDGGANS
ncbi:hypothetical protein KC330_g7138 [Hortaea werneckii]|nr:hypothetical protein KC330_g7138 [Hortaea werneckii]